MLKDLVLKTRSYRRFYENEAVSLDTLKSLVDLARYTASSVNSQALRFKLVNDKENNAKVFETLAWAGLLKDWKCPDEGERPAAYIIVLYDRSVGLVKLRDEGIAVQTILLGASEIGLGGCMFGSVNRKLLAESFDIDTEKYEIGLVVALGKPKEIVELVDIPESGSTHYYRDENGVHYVPKRSLEDLIV